MDRSERRVGLDKLIAEKARQVGSRVDITWGYICRCDRADREKCYHRTIEADIEKGMRQVARTAVDRYRKARRENEVEV